MKKLIYFIAVLFSLTLMSFSGCEDMSVTPESTNPIITLDELNGEWLIVSYKLSSTDHNTFTTCDDLSANEATKNYQLLLLDFKFDVAQMWCDVRDECRSAEYVTFPNFELDLNTNKLTIGDLNQLVFLVKNYDLTTGKLTLELESDNIAGQTPKEGIYLLQKQ